MSEKENINLSIKNFISWLKEREEVQGEASPQEEGQRRRQEKEDKDCPEAGATEKEDRPRVPEKEAESLLLLCAAANTRMIASCF